MISGPPKLLDLIAGRALGDLVPDRLILLASKQLELLVYPSDLAISGTKDLVARARAAVVSRMIEAPAYLTTSAEAQHFEDDIERLGVGASSSRGEELLRHLRSLDEKLARLAVPVDEWETLYRMRLQLERDALVALAGGDQRKEFSSGPARTEPRPRPSRIDLAIGIAGAGLIALDVLLSLAGRRDTRDGRPRG